MVSLLLAEMDNLHGRQARRRPGFTVVELAVVIVVVGVLAALGVPRFIKSVERDKAADAFSYLTAVRAAQERYLAREGSYAANLSDLDVQATLPGNFDVGTLGAGATGTLRSSWTLTLTRRGAPSRYGAYTVIFTDDGFDTADSTVVNLPDINPLAN